MEIELGKGKCWVGSIKQGERTGILIRPNETAHRANRINSKNPEMRGAHIVEETDVVIWISSLASARVLQDRVSIACLYLNGFRAVEILSEGKAETNHDE